MGGLTLTEADQAAKRDALALWESDRARLMLRQPFLALLAMRLELVPVVDERLPTAATDGERVFGNAYFLLALTPADRLFVLAHEVWHCAALHFLRRGHRERELWNLAVDHEVNALLESQGLSMPEGAILYPDQRGQNAEAVYKWLQEHPEQVGPRPPTAGLHEGLPAIEGAFDPDLQLGPGSWEDWPTRVVAAAQQVEQRYGSLPGELERHLERLRRPTIPWRELLARFVADTAQRRREWSKPNRRYLSQGLYLPGWAPEQALEIAVAVDTSGSTLAYLERFMSELAGIAASFGIWQMRLLLCDTRVTADETFESVTPPSFARLSLPGGGGTDFRPVFARLEAQPPRALVFLTDGYGPAPEAPPGYPVLWVLTPQGQAPTAWGEAIRLPEEV